MAHLDPRILAAWAASSSLHRPGSPASAADVAAAEDVLGRSLPPAMVELYLRHDGGDWLHGDLQLMPLLGDELSVSRASATYRGWGWPIPDELVVFGSDGGGDPIGTWPSRVPDRPLVVAVGSIFEAGCMGVVGSDLEAFLLARTGYHLQLTDGTTAALDALGLPQELRSGDPDDETFERVRAWANPGIPAGLADPYAARLTAEDVRSFVAGS